MRLQGKRREAAIEPPFFYFTSGTCVYGTADRPLPVAESRIFGPPVRMSQSQTLPEFVFAPNRRYSDPPFTAIEGSHCPDTPASYKSDKSSNYQPVNRYSDTQSAPLLHPESVNSSPLTNRDDN